MIDGLITAIVRPIRAKYTSLELGPSRIRYGDIEYLRHDFQVYYYPSPSSLSLYSLSHSCLSSLFLNFSFIFFFLIFLSYYYS